MIVTVPCPTCGHACPVSDPPQGADARCPSCLNLVPAKTQPAPLFGRPGAAPMLSAASAVPPAAPNRTVLAQPEAMIRYTCARCQNSLESPVSFAGQKLNCPHCNQRLQIPQSSVPPPRAAPPINKTILAAEDPPFVVHAAAPRAPAPLPPPIPLAPVSGRAEAAPTAPARRESCLECGTDVSDRQRVQTCADCGSVFCSAGCYREHRHHAHSSARRKRRPRDAECEYCGSTARPYETTTISQGGWITFALLLVFFFPLFWIGLLMTETQVKCADCGARLD